MQQHITITWAWRKAMGKSRLVRLFWRSIAVANYWIQIRYYGMSARFVLRKETLVLLLLRIGSGSENRVMQSCRMGGCISCVAHLRQDLLFRRLPALALTRSNLSNPHETAINLFCSCAKVKPSGACRNSTISDCLKYRRASGRCQHRTTSFSLPNTYLRRSTPSSNSTAWSISC
jgi:hypothetical protein